ncbi:TraR/DksA family transcriptional regulator [Nonomuraea africana]|uniref:DnaK suppressor protein n=1 Tax=Nonomuraea africana TaxID=46171 RepID=A0ABR9KBT9_9ACTN|nr:TraR/DksA C4-type zinc finger protein [Nonomuraea africana]MBE1559473.1 DnaK suppressor protein [Nonomuraea africana]
MTTGLSSVQLQLLREELEEHLRWRVSQLAALKASAEDGEDGGDLRDLLAAVATADHAITEARQCLDRLAEGSYGTCDGCGAAIPFERLKVRPLARYCMTCQRRREAA